MYSLYCEASMLPRRMSQALKSLLSNPASVSIGALAPARTADSSAAVQPDPVCRPFPCSSIQVNSNGTRI